MKKYYIIIIVIIIIILSVFLFKMRAKNNDDNDVNLKPESEIKVEEEDGFYRVLNDDEIVYEGNDLELFDLYENDPDFDLKMPNF